MPSICLTKKQKFSCTACATRLKIAGPLDKVSEGSLFCPNCFLIFIYDYTYNRVEPIPRI